MRSSTTLLTSTLAGNNQQETFKIEVLDPSQVMLDSNMMRELANLTTQAFSMHNPQIAAAFSSSTKQDDFIKLSDEQLFDSIQQLAKAKAINNQDSMLIVARDTKKAGCPIVGIVSGVRNGHPHPSHEYMDKLFQSDCGLGAAIGNAFGSVLHHFDMQKMDAYTNVFMLGMIAVHPDYMRQGVSVKLSKTLFNELAQNNYDGLFSIITSPNATGLLKRVMSLQDSDTATLMEIEKAGDSNFFGLAFNSKGINTFTKFNTECRQAVSHENEVKLDEEQATQSLSM
jgi:hypothetical protein